MKGRTQIGPKDPLKPLKAFGIRHEKATTTRFVKNTTKNYYNSRVFFHKGSTKKFYHPSSYKIKSQRRVFSPEILLFLTSLRFSTYGGKF